MVGQGFPDLIGEKETLIKWWETKSNRRYLNKKIRLRKRFWPKLRCGFGEGKECDGREIK